MYLYQVNWRAETAEPRLPWCYQWNLCTSGCSSLTCSEVGFIFPFILQTTVCSLLVIEYLQVLLHFFLVAEVVSNMGTLLSNWMADLWWLQLTCRGHCRKRQPYYLKSGGTTMTCSLTLNLMLSCSRPWKLDHFLMPLFCEWTCWLVEVLRYWSYVKRTHLPIPFLLAVHYYVISILLPYNNTKQNLQNSFKLLTACVLHWFQIFNL